jgi:hypothetical protein
MSAPGARMFGTIRTVSREPALPPHGTRYRYNHRTHRCRCQKCRQGNAAYMRTLRAAKKTDFRTASGRPLTAVQYALPFYRSQP